LCRAHFTPIDCRRRVCRSFIEADKRDQLRVNGFEVSNIVDHGWSKSIYFKDPNGLLLDYCCMLRHLTKSDATMQERFTLRRAALDLNSVTRVQVTIAHRHLQELNSSFVART
jgi:hypothetical protein